MSGHENSFIQVLHSLPSYGLTTPWDPWKIADKGHSASPIARASCFKKQTRAIRHWKRSPSSPHQWKLVSSVLDEQKSCDSMRVWNKKVRMYLLIVILPLISSFVARSFFGRIRGRVFPIFAAFVLSSLWAATLRPYTYVSQIFFSFKNKVWLNSCICFVWFPAIWHLPLLLFYPYICYFEDSWFSLWCVYYLYGHLCGFGVGWWSKYPFRKCSSIQLKAALL